MLGWFIRHCNEWKTFCPVSVFCAKWAFAWTWIYRYNFADHKSATNLPTQLISPCPQSRTSSHVADVNAPIDPYGTYQVLNRPLSASDDRDVSWLFSESLIAIFLKDMPVGSEKDGPNCEPVFPSTLGGGGVWWPFSEALPATSQRNNSSPKAVFPSPSISGGI